MDDLYRKPASCRLSVLFGLHFRYFRYYPDPSCRTSLLNPASVPRTPRALKFVPLTAFTQQRRVRSFRSAHSSTSTPTHASTADSVSMSVPSKRSSPRMTCRPNGPSTSRSTQIFLRRRPEPAPPRGAAARCATGIRNRYGSDARPTNRLGQSASCASLVTLLNEFGFSVQSWTVSPRLSSDGIVLR